MTMAPAKGMRASSISQPLLLLSWRRRTVNASDGTMVAKVQMTIKTSPKMAPGPYWGVLLNDDDAVPALTMMFKTMLMQTETKVHHQYSLRLARPENVAYFLKNRLTATGNGAP